MSVDEEGTDGAAIVASTGASVGSAVFMGSGVEFSDIRFVSSTSALVAGVTSAAFSFVVDSVVSVLNGSSCVC